MSYDNWLHRLADEHMEATEEREPEPNLDRARREFEEYLLSRREP
jgi:hypothetical protein